MRGPTLRLRLRLMLGLMLGLRLGLRLGFDVFGGSGEHVVVVFEVILVICRCEGRRSRRRSDFSSRARLVMGCPGEDEKGESSDEDTG